MKKVVFAIVACVVGLAVASSIVYAQAEAPKAPAAAAKEVVVKGTVAVVKDAAGVVTEISVKPADGKAVKVALDDEGKKLEAMDKKMVEIKGTEKDGVFSVKAAVPVVEEKKAEEKK